MAFDTYSKTFVLTNASAQLSLGLGANETLQISNAYYNNTSGSAVLVYLNKADDGAAAATGNQLETAKSVGATSGAGSALTGKNIIPGAKLYGYASTTGVVNLTIDGIVNAQAPRTW